MRTTFFLLACLLCVSHSRRVQSKIEQLQSEPNNGVADQDTQGVADQDTQEDSGTGSWEEFATILFAATPTSIASKPGVARTQPLATQKPNLQAKVHMSAEADSASPSQPSIATELPEQADVTTKSEPEITQPKKKRPFWRYVAPAVAGAMHATPAVAATAAGANQMGQALGFFNNLRTPATLLTGTALGALFIDLKDNHGPKFKVLRTVYHGFAAFTIACELSCVFMSTTMGVRLLAGGFNPVAFSAVDFLRREFEFEYIACRLAFFTGILSFLSLIGTRAWLTFGEKQPNMARAFIFLLLGVGAFLDAFWRHTVVNYGGYFQMLGRLVMLFFTEFFPQQSFLSGIIMPGCMALSAFYFGKEIYNHYFGKSDTGSASS